MATLPIIKAPDPILKKRCVPVEKVDDEIRTLMDDMLETMYAAPGVGLAAPQVGVAKRVIVIDTSAHDEEPNPLRIANPEIIESSDEVALREEGCLSFPEQYEEVERPVRVKVRYLDHENEIRELQADGLLAICIQHEMDHLEGKVFVDYLSPLKREMVRKKLEKMRRAKSAA